MWAPYENKGVSWDALKKRGHSRNSWMHGPEWTISFTQKPSETWPQILSSGMTSCSFHRNGVLTKTPTGSLIQSALQLRGWAGSQLAWESAESRTDSLRPGETINVCSLAFAWWDERHYSSMLQSLWQRQVRRHSYKSPVTPSERLSATT